MVNSTHTRYRPLTFGVTRVKLRDGAPGTHYLSAEPELQPYARTLTERLQHWASVVPDRTWMARRQRVPGSASATPQGDWQHISYAQAWSSARRIAQALLQRGLSVERPVVVLSENSLEHALLALGCMLAGIPYVPTSPAYSIVSTDYDKLRHVLRSVTPGLLFATDAQRYGKALSAVASDDMEVVLVEGQLDGRASTPFADLLATPDTPAVDAAIAATGPDTIVKFLFTSGSTKLPKAVINTQRMLCANQQQMRQSMPAIADETLVLVDWLPWNHTFGGNHNFNMVLYNGGTLYIDDGKPTPALVGTLK